tara:strand:- start:127 stop:630 length:504 start_codon:yes stop_codon:yes gene_type:complete
MGFDLYGMNPQAEQPKPKWEKGDPVIKVDKDKHIIDPQIKEEYDDYVKSKIEWEDSNEGAYFRNSAWGWRPLWHFVSQACEDILTEKDIERGNYNDGYRISKTKSKRIAKRLRKLIKNGEVSAYEHMYKTHINNLSEKDINRNYPFTLNNVKRFERFCEHSGGFEIC